MFCDSCCLMFVLWCLTWPYVAEFFSWVSRNVLVCFWCFAGFDWWLSFVLQVCVFVPIWFVIICFDCL